MKFHLHLSPSKEGWGFSAGWGSRWCAPVCASPAEVSGFFASPRLLSSWPPCWHREPGTTQSESFLILALEILPLLPKRGFCLSCVQRALFIHAHRVMVTPTTSHARAYTLKFEEQNKRLAFKKTCPRDHLSLIYISIRFLCSHFG